MRTFRTYNEVDAPAAADVPEQVGALLDRLARRLASIRAVWLIGSGKGGVGKSLVTANLAAAHARAGRAVGALDADLNGPSLARMLAAERPTLRVTDDAIVPPTGAAGVRVMSMDLLLGHEDAPLRWREAGPHSFIAQSTLETGALREFLADTAWGELDTLLLDLPPGTDKIIRALELVPEPAGILLVTTPSRAAGAVVRRSLRLVRELGVPRVGLVSNMAGHVCSACGHADPLFGDDHARAMADETGIELWAEIPFHPELGTATDAGRPLVLDRPDHPAARAFDALARRMAAASPSFSPPEAL